MKARNRGAGRTRKSVPSWRPLFLGPQNAQGARLAWGDEGKMKERKEIAKQANKTTMAPTEDRRSADEDS